ncbi:MAG: hypothetical protein ACPG77_14845, partial [Nannocystaceae bacterium]
MTAILIVALALLALGLLSLVHRAQEVEDQLEKAREEVATRLPQGVSQVQEVAKSALAAVRARAQRVRLRGTNSEPAVTLRGYETTACLAWSGLAGADANVQTWHASGRDEVRAQRGSEVA